jgi:hypothetical protein
MTDTPEFLAQRLQTEGQKVLAFFEDLQPTQWETRVYPDEQLESFHEPEMRAVVELPEGGAGWRVRQVLAHFVFSEAGFLRLIANILEGGSGAPEDFDIDRFNRKKVADFEALPPADLLAQFAMPLYGRSGEQVGAGRSGKDRQAPISRRRPVNRYH